jgi:hypothetical protein
LWEPSRVDDLVADHDQLAILALRDPSQVREGLVGVDAELSIKIASARPMMVRLVMAMPRLRISRYVASATEICAAKAWAIAYSFGPSFDSEYRLSAPYESAPSGLTLVESQSAIIALTPKTDVARGVTLATEPPRPDSS